jgi:SM-20-related protein
VADGTVMSHESIVGGLRGAQVPDRAHASPAAAIARIDDFLSDESRKQVHRFLRRSGWEFGWKSLPAQDQYSFWHKHFAGHHPPDHDIGPGDQQPYDCAGELQTAAPILYEFWRTLETTVMKGHTLLRCYANGLPYGAEGTLHTDSVSESGHTTIYYPHDEWHPNWGGETVFFNRERTDIIASVYPRPGRLVVFQGRTPHVARGLSRTCPVMRITLMFKTEVIDGRG